MAVNLCIYFLEHALFPKQSGEFEILSWFISYELFLSYMNGLKIVHILS